MSVSDLDGAAMRPPIGTMTAAAPRIPTALLDEIYVASADRFYAVHRCDLRTTVTSEPDSECSWPAVNTDLLVTTDGGRTWSQAAN